MNNIFTNLDNKIKFILGNIHLILIALTSFILANDRFQDFSCIKIEAILDWTIRLISFEIMIGFIKYFTNITLPFIFIIFTFLINLIIELRMNIKLMNSKEKTSSNKEIPILYEEKCNLGNMVKSVNFLIILIFVFVASSLSVPVNKNMQGATLCYIPVIISIAVYILFLNKTNDNYIRFYLEKDYAKKLYTRDIIFASIGYILCLISSFITISTNAYSYILITGILFLLPMIHTVRKMSIRLKNIRDKIGKEAFLDFVLNQKHVNK